MLDLSQLNAVDWIIIVVLILSTLISLWRGFVREALSLAGWITAFVVAHLFVDQMAGLLAGLIENMTGRYVVAYAALFVLTLVLFSLIVRLATAVVRATGLSVLDRLLGTVFGFARGVILILVLAFVLQQLVRPEDLIWLHESQLMPHLTMVAEWVETTFAGINSQQWISV